MEDLIRNFNSVKECYDKQSVEGLLNSNDSELNRVCLQDRINFIESLNKIDTKIIINERLEIKKVKDHEKADKRREFLNSVFK
jgi:hypothetical protein